MKEKINKILQPIWTVCIIVGCTLTIFTQIQILPSIFTLIGFISLLVSVWLTTDIEREKQNIYFAKTNPNATIPSRDKENGCYDLYACIDKSLIIQPHTNKLVPTGIASAFNSKYRIAFRERGTNTKSNSIVMAGQIDSGYRGEYFVSVYNGNDTSVELTNDIVEIEKTEEFIRIPTCKAICQFAVEDVPNVNIVEVTYEKIRNINSKRGVGALGSSRK